MYIIVNLAFITMQTPILRSETTLLSEKLPMSDIFHNFAPDNYPVMGNTTNYFSL